MTTNDSGDRIRDIKLRRLAVLEEQQAYFGSDARPHLMMEIKELRRELGLPDPSDEVGSSQGVSKTSSSDVTPPKPSSGPTPPHEQRRIHELVDYVKRHALVASTVAWLMSAVFIMAALKEAFEFSQCIQRTGYALLALLGGLTILGISLRQPTVPNTS